ncbi:hypothetical protein [Mesorhizobium sp. 10.2.3]|uniref:hypothetical protein n=2 Tax=Mesorhizobium TaxID=68287 RepID=UPI0010A94F3F|nr:hypothetical protein [Mesorhizobium sp. 10.2.3]
MQKTIFRILIATGVVGVSLPFLVWGGVIGLFMVDAYKTEKRAEESALQKHYQSIYIGREKVSLLSPPKLLPAIDHSPHATIEVS